MFMGEKSLVSDLRLAAGRLTHCHQSVTGHPLQDGPLVRVFTINVMAGLNRVGDSLRREFLAAVIVDTHSPLAVNTVVARDMRHHLLTRDHSRMAGLPSQVGELLAGA